MQKLWTLAFQLHEKTLYIAPHGGHTIDPIQALKFQTKAAAELFLANTSELLSFRVVQENFENLEAG